MRNVRFSIGVISGREWYVVGERYMGFFLFEYCFCFELGSRFVGICFFLCFFRRLVEFVSVEDLILSFRRSCYSFVF